MNFADKVHEQVMAGDSEKLLTWYLNKQSFSGAWFEQLGNRGDDPTFAHRFTAADIAGVATLSVPIPGWACVQLLETQAERINAALAKVPTDVPLHLATDEDLESVYAVQGLMDEIDGIGHVRRSKLLARKRPHLVPIRDTHVLLALMGRDHGPFIAPLRDTLAGNAELCDELERLRDAAGRPDLALIRVLDIVVWMRAHGASSVGRAEGTQL